MPSGIYKRTEETKRKLSLVHLGKKYSEKHRTAVSQALKGNKYKLGYKDREETIVKKSLAHRADKNSNWKGGVTPINMRLRCTSEYKHWRKAVLIRDSSVCQKCGRNTCVETHHIKPFALYPELRYDLNNGLTLCSNCHPRGV